MEREMIINGLTNTIIYTKDDIKLFLEIIEELHFIQREKGRRIIVFLSAPPGLGKSTIVTTLELLEKEYYPTSKIQAIGIDGFHYYNEYLIKHDLKKIKGAITTFNNQKLKETLIKTLHHDTYWPIYDRNLHEPREDAILLHKDIILLEGNYLSHPMWDDLKEFSDYDIFISCKESVVKDRLIQRKVTGGLSLEEAEIFYETSDRKNILEVLENHCLCDMELQYDGYHYSFQE